MLAIHVTVIKPAKQRLPSEYLGSLELDCLVARNRSLIQTQNSRRVSFAIFDHRRPVRIWLRSRAASFIFGFDVPWPAACGA